MAKSPGGKGFKAIDIIGFYFAIEDDLEASLQRTRTNYGRFIADVSKLHDKASETINKISKSLVSLMSDLDKLPEKFAQTVSQWNKIDFRPVGNVELKIDKDHLRDLEKDIAEAVAKGVREGFKDMPDMGSFGGSSGGAGGGGFGGGRGGGGGNAGDSRPILPKIFDWVDRKEEWEKNFKARTRSVAPWMMEGGLYGMGMSGPTYPRQVVEQNELSPRNGGNINQGVVQSMAVVQSMMGGIENLVTARSMGVKGASLGAVITSLRALSAEVKNMNAQMKAADVESVLPMTNAVKTLNQQYQTLAKSVNLFGKAEGDAANVTDDILSKILGWERLGVVSNLLQNFGRGITGGGITAAQAPQAAGTAVGHAMSDWRDALLYVNRGLDLPREQLLGTGYKIGIDEAGRPTVSLGSNGYEQTLLGATSKFLGADAGQISPAIQAQSVVSLYDAGARKNDIENLFPAVSALATTTGMNPDQLAGGVFQLSRSGMSREQITAYYESLKRMGGLTGVDTGTLAAQVGAVNDKGEFKLGPTPSRFLGSPGQMQQALLNMASLRAAFQQQNIGLDLSGLLSSAMANPQSAFGQGGTAGQALYTAFGKPENVTNALGQAGGSEVLLREFGNFLSGWRHQVEVAPNSGPDSKNNLISQMQLSLGSMGFGNIDFTDAARLLQPEAFKGLQQSLTEAQGKIVPTANAVDELNKDLSIAISPVESWINKATNEMVDKLDSVYNILKDNLGPIATTITDIAIGIGAYKGLGWIENAIKSFVFGSSEKAGGSWISQIISKFSGDAVKAAEQTVATAGKDAADIAASKGTATAETYLAGKGLVNAEELAGVSAGIDMGGALRGIGKSLLSPKAWGKAIGRGIAGAGIQAGIDYVVDKTTDPGSFTQAAGHMLGSAAGGTVAFKGPWGTLAGILEYFWAATRKGGEIYNVQQQNQYAEDHPSRALRDFMFLGEEADLKPGSRPYLMQLGKPFGRLGNETNDPSFGGLDLPIRPADFTYTKDDAQILGTPSHPILAVDGRLYRIPDSLRQLEKSSAKSQNKSVLTLDDFDFPSLDAVTGKPKPTTKPSTRPATQPGGPLSSNISAHPSLLSLLGAVVSGELGGSDLTVVPNRTGSITGSASGTFTENDFGPALPIPSIRPSDANARDRTPVSMGKSSTTRPSTGKSDLGNLFGFQNQGTPANQPSAYMGKSDLSDISMPGAIAYRLADGTTGLRTGSGGTDKGTGMEYMGKGNLSDLSMPGATAYRLSDNKTYLRTGSGGTDKGTGMEYMGKGSLPSIPGSITFRVPGDNQRYIHYPGNDPDSLLSPPSTATTGLSEFSKPDNLSGITLPGEIAYRKPGDDKTYIRLPGGNGPMVGGIGSGAHIDQPAAPAQVIKPKNNISRGPAMGSAPTSAAPPAITSTKLTQDNLTPENSKQLLDIQNDLVAEGSLDPQSVTKWTDLEKQKGWKVPAIMHLGERYFKIPSALYKFLKPNLSAASRLVASSDDFNVDMDLILPPSASIPWHTFSALDDNGTPHGDLNYSVEKSTQGHTSTQPTTRPSLSMAGPPPPSASDLAPLMAPPQTPPEGGWATADTKAHGLLEQINAGIRRLTPSNPGKVFAMAASASTSQILNGPVQ